MSNATAVTMVNGIATYNTPAAQQKLVELGISFFLGCLITFIIMVMVDNYHERKRKREVNT